MLLCLLMIEEGEMLDTVWKNNGALCDTEFFRESIKV